MSLISPTERLERSPLYSLHGNAPLTELGGKLLVDTYPGVERQPPPCGLVDLTNLHRVGFRGAHAASYLTERGFDLPAVPNTGVRQASGEWVLRLSQTEYFVLGARQDGGSRLAQLEADWQLSQAACYCLPRQDSHAWLALHGAPISEVMAKLCGVDLSLRAFAPGAVAQTSIARVNGIVVNASLGAAPCFYLLVDRASAHYLWHALLDAMQEFAGHPTGITALP